MKEQTPYKTYLIRLWPTRRGGLEECRVTLDDVSAGERKNFPDLESLIEFLYKEKDRITRARKLVDSSFLDL